MPVNKHQLRASPFRIILYKNVYTYYVYLLNKIFTYLLTHATIMLYIFYMSRILVDMQAFFREEYSAENVMLLKCDRATSPRDAMQYV